MRLRAEHTRGVYSVWNISVLQVTRTLLLFADTASLFAQNPVCFPWDKSFPHVSFLGIDTISDSKYLTRVRKGDGLNDRTRNFTKKI